MCSTGVVHDVALIGLSGKVHGRKYRFLLDSGASCNFISNDLLRKLGLDWDLVVAQSVRLADGTVLTTSGSVQLKVSFG